MKPVKTAAIFPLTGHSCDNVSCYGVTGFGVAPLRPRELYVKNLELPKIQIFHGQRNRLVHKQRSHMELFKRMLYI